MQRRGDWENVWRSQTSRAGESDGQWERVTMGDLVTERLRERETGRNMKYEG